MDIKQFRLKHKDFCNKYNEILDLYYRVCDYIEEPERTKEEMEKYSKYIASYAQSLSNMMIEYTTINKKEMDNRTILGGFIQYDKVS